MLIVSWMERIVGSLKEGMWMPLCSSILVITEEAGIVSSPTSEKG